MRIRGWSSDTLIFSLLTSLGDVAHHYDWQGYTWPREGKLYDQLIDALERYTLPSEPGEAGRSAIVDYVRNIGSYSSTNSLPRNPFEHHAPAILPSNDNADPSGRYSTPSNIRPMRMAPNISMPNRRAAPAASSEVQSTQLPQQHLFTDVVRATRDELHPKRMRSRSEADRARSQLHSHQTLPPVPTMPFQYLQQQRAPHPQPGMPSDDPFHAGYSMATAGLSSEHAQHPSHDSHDPTLEQHDTHQHGQTLHSELSVNPHLQDYPSNFVDLDSSPDASPMQEDTNDFDKEFMAYENANRT
ncbi:uncharacterized protein AB675_9912 [Cyphellophora attinorum]|uniref:Uncharacterized protein n=1 Tax=Cyphellophora attinorum TaxID=1664694 RepID=A0A0N1NYA5_9EURO|nr:uncharacterized protein AB675_9912 [Phialophora attinorum]KPI35367.1 hypothetical protein AB675_9912 [Phialophora attinorum]